MARKLIQGDVTCLHKPGEERKNREREGQRRNAKRKIKSKTCQLVVCQKKLRNRTWRGSLCWGSRKKDRLGEKKRGDSVRSGRLTASATREEGRKFRPVGKLRVIEARRRISIGSIPPFRLSVGSVYKSNYHKIGNNKRRRGGGEIEGEGKGIKNHPPADRHPEP